MASPRIKIGDRVQVTGGSGLASDKIGTVVHPREIKTDNRGVPDIGQGHYKPVDYKKEHALRMDDGSYDTMYKNRLRLFHDRRNDGGYTSDDGVNLGSGR